MVIVPPLASTNCRASVAMPDSMLWQDVEAPCARLRARHARLPGGHGRSSRRPHMYPRREAADSAPARGSSWTKTSSATSRPASVQGGLEPGRRRARLSAWLEQPRPSWDRRSASILRQARRRDEVGAEPPGSSLRGGAELNLDGKGVGGLSLPGIASMREPLRADRPRSHRACARRAGASAMTARRIGTSSGCLPSERRVRAPRRPPSRAQLHFCSLILAEAANAAAPAHRRQATAHDASTRPSTHDETSSVANGRYGAKNRRDTEQVASDERRRSPNPGAFRSPALRNASAFLTNSR